MGNIRAQGIYTSINDGLNNSFTLNSFVSDLLDLSGYPALVIATVKRFFH